MSNVNSVFKKLFGLALLRFTFTNLDAQIEPGFTGGYVKAREEYQRDDLPDDAAIHVEGFSVGIMAYADFNRFLSVGTDVDKSITSRNRERVVTLGLMTSGPRALRARFRSRSDFGAFLARRARSTGGEIRQ